MGVETDSKGVPRAVNLKSSGTTGSRPIMAYGMKSAGLLGDDRSFTGAIARAAVGIALLAGCGGGSGGGSGTAADAGGGSGATTDASGGGNGGTSSGGSAGDCYLPVQFPIEVKSSAPLYIDTTPRDPPLQITPVACLGVAVWPTDALNVVESATVLQSEKVYLTDYAPGPPTIINDDLIASFSPERAEGFAATEWTWAVFIAGGCQLDGKEATINPYLVHDPSPDEHFGTRVAGGTYTIACGQLPFIAKDDLSFCSVSCNKVSCTCE